MVEHGLQIIFNFNRCFVEDMENPKVSWLQKGKWMKRYLP
jgi:hypothetical protein